MGLVWLLSTAKRERLMATSTTTQTRGLQQQLECRPWLALYGVRLQVLPKALTEEEQVSGGRSCVWGCDRGRSSSST
jgi:hypothetical protein